LNILDKDISDVSVSTFIGKALDISPTAVGDISKEIGVEEAVLRAILIVETGGRAAFIQPSNRVCILYEAHYAYRLNGKILVDGLSVPKWTRSLYSSTLLGEYERLVLAANNVHIGIDVALKSASWGLPQIMGNNFQMCGYSDVRTFVQDMIDSGDKQLESFVSFCKSSNIISDMRAKNWPSIARKYNGPAYAENRYDIKLETAYKKLIGSSDGFLGIGDVGPDVIALQNALVRHGYNVSTDGQYGKMTQMALEKFQEKFGISNIGIIGNETIDKLMGA
jgi:hypothetical protein